MIDSRKLILDWIKDNKKTRDWLAKEIGKKPNWFCGWLRGYSNYISKDTLQTISNLTDIEFEKLCTGCNRPIEIKPKGFFSEVSVDKDRGDGKIPE